MIRSQGIEKERYEPPEPEQASVMSFMNVRVLQERSYSLMNTISAFRRTLTCAAALAAGVAAGWAQVTITSADMFNQVGQYYLTYANATSSNSAVAVPSPCSAAPAPMPRPGTSPPGPRT